MFFRLNFIMEIYLFKQEDIYCCRTSHIATAREIFLFRFKKSRTSEEKS